MSKSRGQPVLRGQVPDLTVSAGHLSLLFSDQGSQSYCTTVVITSVSVQLQSEAMQHFDEGNLPQLRSLRVSHDYVFDVRFLVFPLLILF